MRIFDLLIHLLGSSSLLVNVSSLVDGAVCNNCRPRLSELYQKQVGLLIRTLRAFCSHNLISYRKHRPCKCPSLGSGHNVNAVKVHYIRLAKPIFRALPPADHVASQDVLCTSKDCPIFYMRKKAQKDVSDAATVLERFDNEVW